MEIARLEVSMQHHLERMQETAKVNYIQYGKSTKSKKKKPQSSAGATGQGAGSHKTGEGGHRGSRPSGKFNKRPPLPPEFELTKSVKVAFSKTKEEISKNVTLPYFNPKSDTTLQTDVPRRDLEQ